MVLFAFAVLAVDVARLTLAANEVQSVADIAATAGATAAWEGADDAVGQAQEVVALNTVDGATASIDASDVILGHYDAETQTFAPGATPTNAVRANAMATVNNILATILGTPTTAVEKTATAAFTTVQDGRPALPFAIGNCHFDNLCPTCLPDIRRAPSEGSSSAWTGFLAGRTFSDIQSFMPSSCGGGGADAPELHVGDTIHLNTGESLTSTQRGVLLQSVQCQFAAGDREFVVPVVGQPAGESDDDDDSDNGSGDRDDDGDGDDDSGDGDSEDCEGDLDNTGSVIGFVTVRVDSVVVSGENKGINLHGIFNASLPGTPGGNCDKCGSGHAVLIN
jgi:hypothetical protein